LPPLVPITQTAKILNYELRKYHVSLGTVKEKTFLGRCYTPKPVSRRLNQFFEDVIQRSERWLDQRSGGCTNQPQPGSRGAARRRIRCWRVQESVDTCRQIILREWCNDARNKCIHRQMRNA